MSKKLVLAAVTLMLVLSNSFADFGSCEFNFGSDWDYLNENRSSGVAQSIDYATIWLNDASFNQYWHGDMASWCKDNNKTAVFYAYIIAKASGLGDADVGGGLDTDGAAWLKENFSQVKSRYENYASSIANHYGTDKPCIWLMEPDYYQYFSGPQTVKLSFDDASTYLNELMDIVQQHLPNALFSLDISPWNNDQQTYINAFDLDRFSFMHTSGGRTEAGNARIRMDSHNDVTWAEVSSISGKPIIADDGYGVGGGSTGHDASWDDENNLKARISDGVCAITQKSPDGTWGSTISSLKSTLASEDVKCYGEGGGSTGFSLNIADANGGSVTKDPDKSSYSEGSQVTITADPQSGWVFENWSGDASGTDATITVTMDSDKDITPVFKEIPSNEFTLTVNIEGSGTVDRNPEQSTYTGGTEVTLTANPTPGRSEFSGWSDGASGSDQTVTITLNSNQTVTATFTDTVEVDSIRVEAEDFSSKNGDALIVEDQGSYSNIGYIESGYSTTYEVDIPRSGDYTFEFSVACGVGSASFGVSVDDSDEGSVSFNGTQDAWQTYSTESLSGPVYLEAGQRTIQLNFDGPMNMDYFVLKLDPSSPVVFSRSKAKVSGITVLSTGSGFKAVLPANHQYRTYSLVDLSGRIIRSGYLAPNTKDVSFSNLNREVIFLRLEGENGTRVIRTAIIR
ncbi:MAG: InlB B-repeat-containing protein [Fibrobacterota bacterium]